MARNLRRSRRGAAGAKRTSAYNVDDIVEIVRGNATVKARLTQLLSDATSPNPRWLIKFEGLSLKDEEVYEHCFNTNSNQSNDSSDNSLSDREITTTYTLRGGRITRSSTTTSTTADNNSDNERSPPSDNAGEHSDHHYHAGGEKSRAKRALAREARSRRRQAKIEEEGSRKRRFPPPPNYYCNNRNKGGKRGRNGYHNHHNNNNNNSDDEEEVVKVKLLTGTLYMYRGLNRRAEFVRRV